MGGQDLNRHSSSRHRHSDKKCCLERPLASVKEVFYCIWLSRNHQRAVSSLHAEGGCGNMPEFEGGEKGRSRSYIDPIPNEPQERRDAPVDLSRFLSRVHKKELNS